MINGLPRILIIRLSAIGDVTRVLPALEGLRDKYPNAQIDWAVERKSADVVSDHPALDRTLVFDRSSGFFENAVRFLAFCRQIRQTRYDIVVDFHGILKSGFLAGFSGAPKRYGFAPPRSRELSYLFTNRRVRLSSPDLSRVKENMELCHALGVDKRTFGPRIHVPVDIQVEVDTFFDETFDGGKWVVAMHAAVERPEKQWPLENYARLADMLMADGRFEVLLTWGPDQFEIVQTVLDMTRHKPVIAPETPDLKHYAWLVYRADLYCGGDTGPMHIAAAMRTPVAAIFGGSDPGKHAPEGLPCEVLHVPPTRDERDKAAPKSAREYLARITPDMAYEACVRLFCRQGM